MNIHFYNKGALDTVSGGYLYNRKVIKYLRSFGHRVEYCEQTENLRESKINIIDSLVLGQAMEHLQSSARNIGLIHQIDRSITAYDTIPLIVTGEAAKVDLVESFAVNEDAIHVVRPGMDEGWRAKEKHSNQIRNLLCVSNYLAGKGIDVLITVLSELKTFDWKLTIAGNPDFDPEYFLSIQEQIREEGLESRIELLGVLPREKINDLMVNSDVLINLSESETFGMVVKEAIQAHLPVVMYQTGAWKEFEKSGWVTVIKDYSIAEIRAVFEAILESGLRVDADLLMKKTKVRTWEEVSREIESILQNY